MTTPFVRIAPYYVNAILKKRNTLVSKLRKFVGRKLAGEQFEDFVDAVQHALPPTIYRGDIKESARYLVGQKLTDDELRLFCWRIAGNIEQLETAQPVKPWSGQRHHEWMPLQITRVHAARGGRRGMEYGHTVEFRVMGGSACGMLISQWWSTRKCYHMAKFRDDNKFSFGFSRHQRDTSDRTPPHLFVDARQFVTLRCMALMTPDLSEDEPGFSVIAFTSALADWNSEQQRFRARVGSKYACPQGFQLPQMPCHECPVGLDKCRAAVHRATFETKVCRECGDEQYHDPEDKFYERCVFCVKKLLTKTGTV